MQGMKEQSKLVLALLSDAVASDERNPRELLRRVESAVSALSLNGNLPQISREHGQGKAMVNDRLLKAIQKLKILVDKTDLNAKAQLAEMMPYYQQLAEKL
jgi:hypothetical protein